MLLPQLIVEILLVCAAIVVAWELFVIVCQIIAAPIWVIWKVVKWVRKIFFKQ